MKKFFTILSFLLAANLWAETPSLTDFYFIYGGDWELKGGKKIGGKTVEYKAENLLKSAVWGTLENPYAYNSSNTPFVPKNNGNYGVGTKLTINLKKAQNKILILGGYVDPNRHPDYCYKNCRPKTVKIKDLDSDYSVICELTDYAIYQSFDFAKPLTNIEIEVLEVYKGTKYSDLCISGVLFK